MKTLFEKERAEHFLDLLEPYLHHLTVCTMQQDWSEAEGAMSDTPESERDESWQLAYDEMRRKQNTCSCGLGDTIKLIAKIPVPPKDGVKDSRLTEEEIKNKAKDYMKSKGFTRENNIIGGALYEGIKELIAGFASELINK